MNIRGMRQKMNYEFPTETSTAEQKMNYEFPTETSTAELELRSCALMQVAHALRISVQICY